MKIKNILLLAAVSLFGLTACENDGFYYQDDARVRLVGDENWTLGTDSLELSFLTVTGDEAKIDVDACIMGEVSDKDRVANITVDNALTTADTSLYAVPTSVTIPAGSNKATFQVTLRNAKVLKSKTVRLYIKVAESADFKVGVNEENHLILKWSNILTKPLYWDELKEFFGEYSEEKYRFILKTLADKGYDTNLDPSTSGLNWSDLHNYNIVLANALAEYNATHSSSLVDENGALITF